MIPLCRNGSFSTIHFFHIFIFAITLIEYLYFHRMQGITDLFVSIFVIIALSFVPSSFLVYLVDDRSSKSKHLQLVSGLHPFVYWLGNYVWDLVCTELPLFLHVLFFCVVNGLVWVLCAFSLFCEKCESLWTSWRHW